MRVDQRALITATWLCCSAFLLVQLSACSSQADPFPMQTVDWGSNVGGSGNLNAIRMLDPDPEHPELRPYVTGGMSAGSTPLSAWPNQEIGRALHDNVTVRLFAFADDELADADDRADQIARIVSSAVGIWPGPDTRAEVDVHLVPANVSYRYGRLITWQLGMPFRLVLFLQATSPREGRDAGEVAAHELFHVMDGILGRGAVPADADGNSNLLSMTEETFAEIYAACGTLLAMGDREFHPGNPSLSIDGEKFEGFLTGLEIQYFFEQFIDKPVFKYLGPIMAQTAFRALYGDETLMHADDPAGQSMLALCTRIAPDHEQLAEWLQSLNP